MLPLPALHLGSCGRIEVGECAIIEVGMESVPRTLLFAMSFSANTGFAWNFIEQLCAQIADHLTIRGIRTLVAYPSVPSLPRRLAGSSARVIELDTSLNTSESIRATSELIRRENVQVVYLVDHLSVSPAYIRFRRAGARRIIVHDHTSGDRTRPKSFKRCAKWLLARVPGMTADVVVAVSHFVRRRQVEVGMVPSKRVITVWNGIALPAKNNEKNVAAREMFGVDAGRPLILCACRATAEKGVLHLLRAFDAVAQSLRATSQRPVLLYLGDGPQYIELKSIRDSLLSKDDVIFAGYRSDVTEILPGADICVVPSIWQESFSLAVLEAMAYGKAVIASRVGGIPELVEHDVHGLLVPPADEEALARAIRLLLDDSLRRARLGEGARKRAAERFTLDEQVGRLAALVEEGFGGACDKVLKV